MTFQEKKAKLQEDLATAAQTGAAVGLQKNTSNLFRHRDTSQTKKLDVRHFNNVIGVDVQSMEADVEGMTTYEELVRVCLRSHVMPTVVPELKTITIGGALTGVGIESSSFKFGLVHETITEMEVLLGDGQIVIATATNDYSDLFYGFANSYGTLGYVLRLKVKVVPVKPYVRIEHTKYNDTATYFIDLEQAVLSARESGSYDFVDGSIFSSSEMYITKARFVDEAEWVSDYTGQKMYFRSIQKKSVDYVKVKDYIWRWDTDWFWCSKHFGVQNPLIRLFIPKKYLRSSTYWKIRAWANESRLFALLRMFQKKYTESVIQDVEIPIEHCAEFMHFFHEEIGIKPVWACPTMAYDGSKTFTMYPMDPKKLYINFGFWDVVSSKEHHEPGYFNRLIEKKVRELNGKKSLYSDSFYTEEEFWSLYDKTRYDALKKKYDAAKRFKNLYEKCVVNKK